MENKEVRKRNLAWLVRESGGSTAFADLVDRSQVQVSQWIGGTPVGDKLARHIEAKLGRPSGWLDQPQWEPHSGSEIAANPPHQTGPSSQSRRIDHAILDQAKLWVLAEETLAGPYPHGEVVDQVIAVYELMLDNGGVLTAAQRAARFAAAQERQGVAADGDTRTGTDGDRGR